ncbi:MAG TPA: 2-C-methyl-D-erythritol 2,4-cyclodiphosphate synthase [Aquificaceae bacterium]|jgi:2-C-methyl-D-erythritol 2,4-cyclodiphosphate synthase|uniref:2-C-methyl-D-erythritol 2,4-cyclodiphosphate synthase n=1 Tax=Hydrogenobacter sp. TaxID=2152829 RepID=A0A7C2VAP0_9AQUI|nr:2-C-methyl-D-erythritol 2,4-cyclodiphosphate synthase [Aquificaceae bacterium]
MKLRIGLGFDSHAFEEGKPLKLGGLLIDFPKGLRGHSDGDALLHAITDALLGAIGEPDIGELFSDKDPRWKGVSSEVFLNEALRRAKEKGYKILNIDCVIVADEPKIAPHKEAIKESLSRLLDLPKDSISIKGKSQEGFCKEEGLACFCTILLIHEG